MAVSIEDIKKLRHMTGAGMMDCKNALAETDGDIQAAIEIIRKKGQAVAAKREDRNAAEGCVFSGVNGNFAAVVTLKCETDFVAKNESFRALAKRILEVALANKVKSAEELKAATLDGRTVAELITDEIGKTGEKMELGDYACVEAATVASYNHFNDKLAAIAGFNIEGVDAQVGREICMQIASMNPVAVSRNDVPQATIDQEISVAIEKTKQEQVVKAQEAALRKAGLNPNHFDSEDHIESNITKGWITKEEAEKGRQIMKEAGEAKAANLPEQMIQNIANGRLNKFFKESCLMEQAYVQDAKISVGEFLNKTIKGLVVTDFKRINLNAD
ncbi:MAG: translation elongation factor Ts [Muribaculaceae bacterium]|nr:elongation factor Ts [Muribaculaceae bacterium]MCI6495169.1 translation elongation factor Ts [Bacteroidales bacterium]MDD6702459.1 translation elongation factor Ts [Bacteroidales bacterium]MDD6942973.1 translation elongation factor Ts [Bacteroidales bacterium]MDY2734072.1 translation elongation factor Ts [Muribaculaceae bacterium]